MAEVKEEEQQKKGGILKIILFVIGGILLIILGLGIGYFIFGGEPEQDPSQEVNQIIEGEPKVKDDQNKDKNTDETNEEGIITKNVKTVPDVDAYETTYFEFPGDFTTNLKNSKKFLQISVGVSTQYDEKVIEMVDQHQLALRSEILGIISEFTAEDVSNREGKKQLAEKLKEGINLILEDVEGFGGVENVHFTSFVLQ